MKSGEILIFDQHRGEMALGLQELIRSATSHAVETRGWNDMPAGPYDLLLPVLASKGGRCGMILEELSNSYQGAAIIPVISGREFNSADALALVDKWTTDFITYPYRSLDVIPRIERALKKPALNEIEDVKRLLSENWALKKLVGRSPLFLEVVNKIPLVARSDVEVLIQGETGTGKELLARALHYLSPREGHPFIPVNSAALPAALFENELFGHAKEAFTDARSTRSGLIREAEGGTIFLDEIDTLEPSSQAKLLRFLEEKEYKPLGSGKSIKANVRIITATNTDLKESVKAGRFRQDLFYRLNVIPLTLPPLRERREDIPILANYFLKKYEQRFGIKEFSPAAMEMFSLYPWPGNIRELENVVQHLMILVPYKIIGPESLPFSTETSQYSLTFHTFQDAKRQAIETFEREYIAKMLRTHNGNITRAAKAAGKDRRVFGRLVKKHKEADSGLLLSCL